LADLRASTLGATVAATWLRSLGHPATTERWHVEIALDVIDRRAPVTFDEARATRFHIDAYLEEWGLYFCHGGRWSWIRVTDIAFVHGRDDHGLLAWGPTLEDVGALLRRLEGMHGISFHRKHANIRTNLAGVEPAVRGWLATL